MKVRANWRVWLAFVHDVCAAAVAWVGLYWLRANLDYQVNLKNELLLSDIIRRLDSIEKRKPREHADS